MSSNIRLEICVDSLESCEEAIKGGAHRLELCSSLFLGGLTPSWGMMKIVRERFPNFPIHVMIRPRGGDFLYSKAEIEIMKQDILAAKQLGFNGVVFGLLNADGSIDKHTTSDLIQLSLPMSITFHRAFGIKDLLEIGNIERLLTSGTESSVLEGIDVIRDLIKLSEGRIKILPGGGITERNISKIIKKTGLYELHLSGRIKHDSKMIHRNERVFMGGELRQSEYSLSIVDHKKIGNFITSASST
eukprot:gene7711-9485_t